MSPAPHSVTACRWCGAEHVPIVNGRYVIHPTDRAEVCPSSETVPWRRGVPDQDTVVRHLQTHSMTGEVEAYFQVRVGLAMPAIVTASFDKRDRLVWGYAIAVADLLGPHARRIEPNDLWFARPLDIETHEARPWIDP